MQNLTSPWEISGYPKMEILFILYIMVTPRGQSSTVQEIVQICTRGWLPL